MGRLCAAGILAALVLLADAGCSSSATSTLGQAVSQATSAAQTARTTLAQLTAGRLVPGVASTAFEDMLKEAEDAESTALGATPATATEQRSKSRVVAVLHATTLAIARAEDAAEGTPGAPARGAAVTRLTGALDQLAPLQRRLGSGR